MCELRTYLASYKRLYTNAVAMPRVSQKDYTQSIVVTTLKLKDKSVGSKSECRPDTQM